MIELKGSSFYKLIWGTWPLIGFALSKKGLFCQIDLKTSCLTCYLGFQKSEGS